MGRRIVNLPLRSRAGWDRSETGCRLPRMREVEVRLRMKLADAMSALRTWLDHNECTPVSFDVIRAKPRGLVVVRIVFADDEMANTFLRDFGS